jgi:hypothetical protein
VWRWSKQNSAAGKHALSSLERFIRARWQTPFEATKRVVGGAVLLIALLFVPIPLSNVPPALTIVLLAFAYLEEDGALLCATLLIILAPAGRTGRSNSRRVSSASWHLEKPSGRKHRDSRRRKLVRPGVLFVEGSALI